LRRSHAAYARYAATLPQGEREAFARKLATLRWHADVALSIATAPPGATVRIDGVARGTTPQDGTALSLTVAGGKRVVELLLEGHEPARRTLVAEFGEPRALSIVLHPFPRPAALRVEASREATVVVDGLPAGLTPRGLTLPPGSHEIEISATETRPLRRRLHLAAGDRVLLAAALAPSVTSGTTLSDARARRVWLLASGSAAVLSAASLAVGIAYNARYASTYEGSPELTGYRAAGTTGYALSGALAFGAAVGFVSYYLTYLRGRRR
jgi:hypothetical protein